MTQEFRHLAITIRARWVSTNEFKEARPLSGKGGVGKEKASPGNHNTRPVGVDELFARSDEGTLEYVAADGPPGD